MQQLTGLGKCFLLRAIGSVYLEDTDAAPTQVFQTNSVLYFPIR